MISQESVSRIIETAEIEEVVGDFVQLKKRGSNLLGLCPFHNEKTPSFSVSPSKGIFKCFGCGKAGSPVDFVMEHEKITFPEALRYLAKKYSIEIVETQSDNFSQEEFDRKESLVVVSEFAMKYYSDILWNTDEGRSIGLSYFTERGFREDTVRKFNLGYSLPDWDSLSTKAISEGFKEEFLTETGLSIYNEERKKIFDRFRGRVMFPVHSLTGRVIAFGGRILKTDPKTAKYLNSPESEIYHKSSVLYGAYFAKKAIREFDKCYLVEGYTDVISLHQAGIENVVSSSGTSLTTEQIKIISRFTKNITILYDGDAAGVNASLRGIDMILEQGMNVKIVLFPEGQDPDSYVRATGGAEFNKYLSENEKDFILFRTELLLDEVKNDPIKKAGLIHEIVESISKIPDQIAASLFIKQCSVMMDMEERVLLSEYNKIKARKSKREFHKEEVMPEPDLIIDPPSYTDNDEFQEKEIIRLLLNYGSQTGWDKDAPEQTVAGFILEFLDNVEFCNPRYAKIISTYNEFLNRNEIPNEKAFVNHGDKEVRDTAAELLSTPYLLSENWEKKHQIYVSNEEQLLKQAVNNAIVHLQMRKVMRMIEENKQKFREAATEDEQLKYQQIYIRLNEVKVQLSQKLGAVILK